MEFLNSSVIIRGLRRIGRSIGDAARQSMLFGEHERREAPGSGILDAAARVHPLEGLLARMRQSRILSWLYHYWAAVVGGRMAQLLALLLPFAAVMAVRMAMAARWGVAGLLLIAAGLAVLLLSGRGTLRDWLEGSLPGRWILKRVPLPAGEAKRSVVIYLGVCGALGGAVGWLMGLTLGLAAALALAVLPVLFRVPPFWLLVLLCGLLPVLGTTVCWILSVLVAVTYFFARAFGGLAGKKLNAFDLLLGLFPIFCAVSTLFSLARGDSAKVMAMWLGLYACVFFIRRLVTSRKALMAALGALTLGAVVSGFCGIYQYVSGATGAAAWLDSSLFNEVEARIYSTFANPNVYGEFLLLVLPLVAAMALYVRNWRWKVLLIAADVLLAVNLVLTYSRGCYVGLALTAVVFLWNYSKKWLAAVAVVGIPLAMLLMPTSVVERISSIGNMSDSSTSYRMMIYIGTALMLVHYWAGGVGIGELAFNAIYPIYSMQAIVAPHSHSLFLQAVVSFGIFGLVYLLMVLIQYQKKMQQSVRSLSGRERSLMLGFSTVFWGFLVQSVFDYTWYNYRVFQLFWIVIVLGLAAAELLKEPEGGKNNG